MLKDKIQAPEPGLSDFLEHFSSVFGSEGVKYERQSLGNVCKVQFTQQEVCSVLASACTGKSAGDWIAPIEYLKCHRDSRLVDCITQIINAAIRDGVPQSWNTILLLPLYKGKGDANVCSNYRGIALMQPLAKLYAKLVLNRLL